MASTPRPRRRRSDDARAREGAARSRHHRQRVAPGPTATDLFLDGKSPELIERLAKLAPLERLGKPEDIAAVVAFLAGPDGAWVNGQVLARQRRHHLNNRFNLDCRRPRS